MFRVDGRDNGADRNVSRRELTFRGDFRRKDKIVESIFICRWYATNNEKIILESSKWTTLYNARVMFLLLGEGNLQERKEELKLHKQRKIFLPSCHFDVLTKDKCFSTRAS